MIAADTCTVVAFLSGAAGRDVDLFDKGLDDSQVVFPAVVITEILSDPKLGDGVASWLARVPKLEIDDGFWERAGWLRNKVISKGHKARVADALIAQNCIDHKVSLITRDKDFRHFEKFGLILEK